MFFTTSKAMPQRDWGKEDKCQMLKRDSFYQDKDYLARFQWL